MAKEKQLTEKQKESMVLNIVLEPLENDDVEGFFQYLGHVKIDLTEVPAKPPMMVQHILEHYRTGGKIDLDRAANDLKTFPPVAARVLELMEQRQDKDSRK